MEDLQLPWTCPWCGTSTQTKSASHVICDSRACTCGALGLCAHPADGDEVIDDAINVFGIADGFLTEYNSDRFEGLLRHGVEVARGALPHDYLMTMGKRNVLWFRVAVQR